MKISENTKEKKEKIKKKEKKKPKKEHVLIVAQEIKFARLLSGNEKKTRDKVLNTLKKWLLNCFEKGYDFKEDDFIRVWKGLFYAVWMSDKPLVQEELCEKIAGILDLFPEDHLRSALLMYKAGLRVVATEWYGLDQHRTDKFLMLVRRFLRGSLRLLQRGGWDLRSCQLYSETLAENDGVFAIRTPHYARNSMSMLLHFVDCYLEEIAKVSDGDIPDASFVELLRPLCTYMSRGEAPLLCAAVRRMMTSLVRQSEPGLRYQHATAAWQKMGCPEGGPEALELVSDSEDDEEDQQNGEVPATEEVESSEKALDPRAGRVNVELPVLPVPAKAIADMLRGLLATATSGRHRRVYICLQCFEKLSRSEYPLRVVSHSMESPAPPAKNKKSAQALHAMEKKLVADSDELALRGLSRKHRKRLLAKSRSGTSIVEEVETVKQKLSTNVTNGGWQVETSEPEAKKLKQTTTSNKQSATNNKHNKTSDKHRKTNDKQNTISSKQSATHNKHNKTNDKQTTTNNKETTTNNDNKKRKTNANDTSDGKKRKVDDTVNKDTADKQHKVDETQKVAKDDHNVPSKLGKTKKVDQFERMIKDKIGQNRQRMTDKINQNKKDKINKKILNIKNTVAIGNGVSSESDVVIKNRTQSQADDNNTRNNNKTNNNNKPERPTKNDKNPTQKTVKKPTFLCNKVKQFPKKKELNKTSQNGGHDSPKKVKFALKMNSMQQPVDYYKSVSQSPSIPFDGAKKPSKTNLKPSTPSPINPFFKKKMRMKH